MDKKKPILIVSLIVIVMGYVGYLSYNSYKITLRNEEAKIRDKEMIERGIIAQEPAAQQRLKEVMQEVDFPVFVPKEIPDGYHLVYDQGYADISSETLPSGIKQIMFFYEHPRGIVINIRQFKIPVNVAEKDCKSRAGEEILLKNDTTACLVVVEGRHLEGDVDVAANIRLDYYIGEVRVSMMQTDKDLSIDGSLLAKSEVIEFAEAMIE